MPVMELINNVCNFAGAEQTAQIMAAAIKERGNKVPGFYFFRIVWVNPTNIADTLAALRRQSPELKFEVLEPANSSPSLGALQVELSSADLARIEQCVPATAISGTRYDEHQMRMLDSERTGP